MKTSLTHRLSAFIKDLALGKVKGLPILRYEAWILDRKDQDDTCEVPWHLLQAMVSARACAQEMLVDPSLACLADMQRQLRNNSSLLLSMDRSFRFELEWIANAGDEQLGQAIHRSILDCLPSQSASITLSQACTKLGHLLDSDMGKFASLRSQSEIKTVRKVLDKMATGVSPDCSVRAGGPLFEQVWARLQHFIIVKVLGDKASSQTFIWQVATAKGHEQLMQHKTLTHQILPVLCVAEGLNLKRRL